MFAVEVHNLRKEFVRREKGVRTRRRVALKDVSFTIARGECVADPRPERLGQVDARPPALDAAAARRRLRPHLRPRRLRETARRAAARQPRLGRGQLLQADERRGEPLLRGAVLRDDAAATRERIPEILDRVGFPSSAAASRWRTSRAGCSRRSRSRARCSPRRCCCSLDEPTTGLDPRSKLEVQDLRPRDAGRARRDDPALHARPGRGRGARRPRRHPRPRRAALPRAGRRAARALRRRRRSRRRSSRRPGRTLRRGGGRRRGREVFAYGPQAAHGPPRADRPRRRRRAQLVPRQALRLVGARVLPLDGREHAHDRLHREGRSRRRAAGRRERARRRCC